MTTGTGAQDLVIRNGLVMPMVANGECFHGEVVIRNGRIEAVTDNPTGRSDAAHILDAHHRGEGVDVALGREVVPTGQVVAAAEGARLRHQHP